MKLITQQTDLFTTDNKYVLAHCISADFGMSGGIVVMFNKLFDMKNILIKKYSDLSDDFASGCVRVLREESDRIIYNLVTKRYVWDKPTYSDLLSSLIELNYIMELKNEKYLAIPLIGCGIDGLKWSVVKELITQVFEDSDIEILVCYLEKDKELLEV